MLTDHLDFEKPLVELQQKIDELTRVNQEQDIDLSKEIEQLSQKKTKLAESIFSQLTPAQVVQIARHPQRPHALDCIQAIFTHFQELHGDRHFGKGAALIGGLARLNNMPVMVIGQEKGRNTTEKVARNFGMTTPEGFRKALRLMKLAEKFQLPVFTFIDTPGAYPGIGAEERNQSEAIARNLFEMAQLKTPIICTIIGEGCSGGALAIGLGDRTLMLAHSYYSVISPEGCASILWKSAEKAGEAANALGLTADKLKGFGLVDDIIKEPLGGAHTDPQMLYQQMHITLTDQLAALKQLDLTTLLEQRYDRWTTFDQPHS